MQGALSGGLDRLCPGPTLILIPSFYHTEHKIMLLSQMTLVTKDFIYNVTKFDFIRGTATLTILGSSDPT